eukprot:CAMPEP_0185757394 /NCGR_PEP_ID=MMETSP1174-20130828/15861_1 /TAXON_ID=35687 /ORGANISM="Dictyocha speculum, Strain CCMP1381" /LENGTH=67 /DNA_ID=CAMNT_0028436787 /DNA_START=394 /DNA_END=597 /DNA_ORIENTATION=-
MLQKEQIADTKRRREEKRLITAKSPTLTWVRRRNERARMVARESIQRVKSDNEAALVARMAREGFLR